MFVWARSAHWSIERTSAKEGRTHHRDEGGLILEPLAEADKEDVDELAIIDRITKFAKFIRGRLEVLAVDADGCITLHHIPKLGVEIIGASIDVVLEELTNGYP